MNSFEILTKLRLHPTSDVYQVGCNAVRLNVYAQQQRAFNLVWALQDRGKLPAGVSVAVIGGGIAGLTAAAALAAAGATVKLFEKMSDVAHLQTGNVTRFLHPNIAIWPNETFGYSVTHIPFLNWRSDTDTPSYWRNDHFVQPILGDKSKRKLLREIDLRSVRWHRSS